MTIGQIIKKKLYPVWMFFQKGKQGIRNTTQQKPSQSFYALKSIQNNGNVLHFDDLRGKKVLIVNTASDCIYTNQYEELEQLYQEYKDRLLILGFPSDDFGGQEKAGDTAIAQFCKINFGVSFPLMQKSTVKKTAGQHEVYQWLTEAAKNGWNNQPPQWNFSKYLIDEEGTLISYFPSAVSPLDAPIKQLL